jgi:hypothetical protein
LQTDRPRQRQVHELAFFSGKVPQAVAGSQTLAIPNVMDTFLRALLSGFGEQREIRMR